MTYKKILVARHSPQNECFAPPGDVLVVKAKETVPAKEQVPHCFVSARTPEKTSKYGWVKTRASFTFEDFTREHVSRLPLSYSDIDHLRIMLDSIQNLPDETPVAASYSSRGVELKKMVFTVHRVIFRKAYFEQSR